MSQPLGPAQLLTTVMLIKLYISSPMNTISALVPSDCFPSTVEVNMTMLIHSVNATAILIVLQPLVVKFKYCAFKSVVFYE